MKSVKIKGYSYKLLLSTFYKEYIFSFMQKLFHIFLKKLFLNKITAIAMTFTNGSVVFRHL